MQKIWQITPKIKDEIIKNNPEYDWVILQIFHNRGITDEKDIKDFLNKNLGELHDPFLFRDMNSAVDLIIEHIKKQSKIMVYGDYDVDGVTSSAVLKNTLGILKGKVDVYIPYRVTEGYGLNKNAIDSFVKDGINLIITVDTGIRNIEEVAYAKSKGLDIIVTDHHPDGEDVPDCLIINPAASKEPYPFKSLAGVGVAFKLAKAIISRTKLTDREKYLLEERNFDLTAIGTVADCMPLLGENRIIVDKGLEMIAKSSKIGLQELMKISQVNTDKKMEAWNIGFQLGPRLNAAGRIGHANTAFDLLTSTDKETAEELAKDLNDKNIKRQQITENIIEDIEKQVAKNKEDKIIIGICPNGAEAWNEGVVGLAAGKICEKYYKPTLVITKTEDGYKGSGRSIEEFNIIKSVEACSEYLDKYGGHPAACGFSFDLGMLENFTKKITEVANRELKDTILQPKIQIDCELNISEIDEKLVKKIENFAPFGQGNPQPRFVSKNVQIKDLMVMGKEGNHIKFRFNGFGGWHLAKQRNGASLK